MPHQSRCGFNTGIIRVHFHTQRSSLCRKRMTDTAAKYSDQICQLRGKAHNITCMLYKKPPCRFLCESINSQLIGVAGSDSCCTSEKNPCEVLDLKVSWKRQGGWIHVLRERHKFVSTTWDVPKRVALASRVCHCQPINTVLSPQATYSRKYGNKRWETVWPVKHCRGCPVFH